jgi:hypothetical protein
MRIIDRLYKKMITGTIHLDDDLYCKLEYCKIPEGVT